MAEFDIRKEKALLYEYLTLVEGEYFRFIQKNNINRSDADNPYVANLNELSDIDDQRWQLKTEEEVKKAKARAKELANYLKEHTDPNSVPKRNYSELDPNKDYTEFKIENDIEHFRELISVVQGKIGRYICRKDINDTKDPIYILTFKLQEITNDITMGKVTTLEELKMIRCKIDFIDEYIDEVINKNG